MTPMKRMIRMSSMLAAPVVILAAFGLASPLPQAAKPAAPAPAATPATAVAAAASHAESSGFVPIFDGQTLAGWHVSARTQHGSGGRWAVENGAIVGGQDKPGNGGIVITDAHYGDFEVVLETNNDFGPDSGLFLRSTEEGMAYQVLVDYHADGYVGGLYGERFPVRFAEFNFQFLDAPDRIKPGTSAFPLPVPPDLWPDFWKHGAWNTIRARITGNPPTIDTWVNGVQFMHWTGKEKVLGDKGGIALQVHGGAFPPGLDLTKLFVRYRNIRVKVLGAAAK